MWNMYVCLYKTKIKDFLTMECSLDRLDKIEHNKILFSQLNLGVIRKKIICLLCLDCKTTLCSD